MVSPLSPMRMHTTHLGADVWANIVLKYSEDRIANLFYTGLHTTPCQATISGKVGHIRV